tara:strand:+ start:415 stop:1284 length:870 start_codon:yes stop_codon:yes gene_type:complete
MTGTEFVTELGRRVEDEDNVSFDVNHKLQAINNGVKTLTTLLHNYYLSTLKKVANDKVVHTVHTSGFATRSFDNLFSAYTVSGVTATSPTNGDPTVFTKSGGHTLVNGDSVELSDFTEMTDVNGITGTVEGVAGNNFSVKGVLGSPAETTGGTVTKLDDGSSYPVREGITRIYDNTNSRYAQLVPEQSFMPSSKTYSYGTMACIEGYKLTIVPNTVASVDIHYIAQPTAIANDSVVSEWYNGLENIILDFAESEIFYADNRPNRAGVPYQRAINMIQTLNDRAVGDLVG